MRKMRVIGLLVWSVLCVSVLMGQVSLRNRVVMNQTADTAYMSCGVSFGLTTAVGEPITHIGIGTPTGVMWYRYMTDGGTPVRVGRVYWGARIVDMDEAPIDSGSRLVAVVDSHGRVLLWRYDGSTVSPYGVASLNASRVQVERLSSGQYLVVVGRLDGRVQCYVWSLPASPAPKLDAPLSLGSVVYDQPWYSRRPVRALRVWTAGGQVYAVFGGEDGLVYQCLWNWSGLVQVGKAGYHPSAVVEIVVNGGRVVVACEMGHVYVWNWSGSGLSYHIGLKYVASRLWAHSLSALSGDRVAIATGQVRVYSLSDGRWLGMLGTGIRSVYLIHPVYANAFWFRGFAVNNYLWREPSPLRVLPNPPSYFVVGSTVWGGVQFIRGSTGLSVSSHSSYPVGGLAEVPGGVVSVYGDGLVVAPWGNRNVGSPVMATLSVGGSPAWVLGSYGVGRVFAWSSSGAFIADVLPAPSVPRVVSVLRLLSVSGSTVRFVVGSYGGDLEVWEWQLGSSSLATRVSSLTFSGRVTDISVAPDKSNLLVVVGGVLKQVPVNSSGVLGTAQNLITSGVLSAQYHPTDGTRAVVSYGGSILVATLSPSFATSVVWFNDIRNPSVSQPLAGYCAWASGTEVVSASPHGPYVGVFETAVNTLMASQLFTGSNNSWRGIWDRSLREVYNAEQGTVSSLLVLSDGSLAIGTRTGRVVQWVRGGRIVSTSYVDGPVNTVDFAPQSGARVLPGRVFLTGAQALLMRNGSYYFTDHRALPVLALSGGSGVQARVMDLYFSHDVSSTDVVIKHRWTSFLNYAPNYLPAEWGYRIVDSRLESSEDGQWLLLDHSWYIRQVGSSYEYWCALHLIPESKYFTGTTSSEFYQVQFPNAPNSSWDYSMSALSPGGVRVAVGLSNNEVRVYDRVGSSWNFSSPSSVLSVVLPTYFHLRFLADDVLLLAYPESGSGVRVAVYQLSGGSWVLRSSLATGSGYDFVQTGIVNRYIVDSLSVGSVVRVAVSTTGGLVFYKLTRSGGVVSLTEVGRTSSLANGFMDMVPWSWVRFSRYAGHNGNYIGVAQHYHSAIVYDLQGLFSW